MKKFDPHKWAVEFSETDPLPDDFHLLELWALSLLQGFDERKGNGVMTHTHLSPEEELPYRRALAYVLRCDRPLWWELRRALADLIWEDEVPCQRRIVFEKKGRGQYRDHTRTTAIARMVLEQIKAGASQAAAIAETSYNLQIELRQVQRIWARYRPGFEWLGELPPSNRDTKSRKKTVAKHRSQRT